MAEEKMVKVDLKHSVGLRGTPIYGPGQGIEVPESFAQKLGLTASKAARSSTSKAGGEKEDSEPKFTSKSAEDAAKGLDLSGRTPSGAGGKFTVEDVTTARFESLFASPEALAKARDAELDEEDFADFDGSGADGKYTSSDVDQVIESLDEDEDE